MSLIAALTKMLSSSQSSAVSNHFIQNQPITIYVIHDLTNNDIMPTNIQKQYMLYDNGLHQNSSINSTANNFETTIFSHHLLLDPIFLTVNSNHVSHLICWSYDHPTVTHQIYTLMTLNAHANLVRNRKIVITISD